MALGFSLDFFFDCPPRGQAQLCGAVERSTCVFTVGGLFSVSRRIGRLAFTLLLLSSYVRCFAPLAN